MLQGAPTEIITTSNIDQPNFHSSTVQEEPKTVLSSVNGKKTLFNP